MDDHRALMAAIIASPDEDTPRLALADWLQEHGDEHDRARAEFIRLQIRAAGDEPAATVKRLKKEAATLHKAHAQHWLGSLWGLATSADHYEFHRGTLNSWYTTAGNFLKSHHQEAARVSFPRLGVGRLILVDNTKRVSVLANSPALAWVMNLTWYDAKIEDDGFAALAAAPHFTRLSRLWIDKPRCTDAGLKALARSNSIPNLRIFGLHDGLWRGRFSAAGVKSVLEGTCFPRLEELDLSGAHTHAVAGGALFDCEALSRLRVLRLGFGSDTKALAKCPHLTNLEELHVGDSKLSDNDAQAMAENPIYSRLKVLSFTELNAQHPPLGTAAEKALRDRFGGRLRLEYSVLCRN